MATARFHSCLLLQALLLVSSGLASDAQEVSAGVPEYNVTLRSITLLRSHSWFAPSVFFRCQPGNTTSLRDVTAINKWYNFSGSEPWQPVTRLHPLQCQQCGVFQRLWFKSQQLAELHLCPSNFSSVDSQGLHTHLEPGAVQLNLACFDCSHHPPPTATSERKQQIYKAGFTAVFWLMLGISFIGVFVACVSVLVLAFARLDMIDEGEKKRFIEMTDERPRQNEDDEEKGNYL